MSKRGWRWAIVAVILALAATGCGGETARDETAVSVQPADVDVAAVATEERPETIEAVGTVRARRTVVVASKILSHIRVIHVEEGERVTAGQPLIGLDNRELTSAREAVLAARAEVDSAIQAAGYALQSAQAQSALAETTYKRFSDLLRKESVSKQEYDEAEARLRSAQAAVEAASAQRDQAVSQRAQTEARIASADVMLSHATIESPVTGIVVERLADPGSLARPGEPILRIEEAGAYRLEAAVPASLLGSVRIGQTISVAVDALEGSGPMGGTIAEIVPEIDPASRTFQIKIGFPANPSVRSGLYGRALIPRGTRTVLSVPAEAVSQRGQLRSVFVVQDNVARRRLVTLGDLRGGAYEVLSGLDEGELVVLQPSTVDDGAPVRPQQG